ncbi:hypothetical protein GW750_02395 [bacterium]|nr:hypothetical protein [bacterium]
MFISINVHAIDCCVPFGSVTRIVILSVLIIFALLHVNLVVHHAVVVDAVIVFGLSSQYLKYTLPLQFGHVFGLFPLLETVHVDEYGFSLAIKGFA